MLGKHGNYRNISKIQKTAISKTGENENFGKKCLTQGLRLSGHYFTVLVSAVLAIRGLKNRD
jgi:hypothetical protein